MTRTSRALAFAAGLAVALTACGGNEPDETQAAETTPETTPTEEAPSFSGSLTVWSDETRGPIISAIGEEFTATTGVSVEVVEKDFGDIRDDLVTQGPTGQGPDIVIGAHDWVGKLVQNGALAPVELGDKAAESSRSPWTGSPTRVSSTAPRMPSRTSRWPATPNLPPISRNRGTPWSSTASRWSMPATPHCRSAYS